MGRLNTSNIGKFISGERLVVFLGLVMLVKISYIRELNYLIHPRYFWLVYLAIAVLVGVMVFDRQKNESSKFFKVVMGVLVVFFGIGIGVKFQPLTSFAQEQKIAGGSVLSLVDYSRGKRLTAFGANTKSRTLGDWVRAFSINPEPRRYEGQNAKITGFYYLNIDGQPMIARYALSCCAADARVIGVRLVEKLDVPVNTWLEVNGVMKAKEVDGDRFVALDLADKVEVPIPDNPYVIN